MREVDEVVAVDVDADLIRPLGLEDLAVDGRVKVPARLGIDGDWKASILLIAESFGGCYGNLRFA